MTEFETAYLVNDIQLAITANSSMLFTMVSAFLLASYVAAHRLSPLMVALLIGIYAYAFFGTSIIIERQMVTMFGLTDQIAARAGMGNNFQWHAAAAAGVSETAATVRSLLPLLNLLVTSVIFVATLVFFFHCRRVNRKAEVVVEVPKV